MNALVADHEDVRTAVIGQADEHVGGIPFIDQRCALDSLLVDLGLGPGEDLPELRRRAVGPLGLVRAGRRRLVLEGAEQHQFRVEAPRELSRLLDRLARRLRAIRAHCDGRDHERVLSLPAFTRGKSPDRALHSDWDSRRGSIINTRATASTSPSAETTAAPACCFRPSSEIGHAITTCSSPATTGASIRAVIRPRKLSGSTPSRWTA